MDLSTFSRSNAPAATVLIRLAVGGIFLSEGLQKFIFPAAQGVGRFVKIGLPWPGFLAPLVGGFETACGLLVLAGLLTRLAVVPLFVVISTAIVTTKIPLLLGHAYWGLELHAMPSYGIWSMAHEARTDFAMWTGSLFLLYSGAGPLSLDSFFRAGDHQT